MKHTTFKTLISTRYQIIACSYSTSNGLAPYQFFFSQIIDLEPFSSSSSPSPLFPGIQELANEFQSLKWIWDKTPRFKVKIGEVGTAQDNYNAVK